MNSRGPWKGRPLSQKAALAALANLDETSARINLAALALAAPLLSMRAGQAGREAARAEADPEASEGERAARKADRERLTEDVAALARETARMQVSPAAPRNPDNAVLTGRVTEEGKPVKGARVLAEAGGERLDHGCADEGGRFALEVPANAKLIFAVARATGPIVHREKNEVTYAAGQRAYREFELGAADAPCPAPEDDKPARPKPGTRAASAKPASPKPAARAAPKKPASGASSRAKAKG